MLKDATEAKGAERDQDADCARIDAATAMAEQEIAALEGQHLDPHEIRRSAIRDRTILAIRDVRRNIANRARDAKETETSIIEKLLRQESDGRILREFSATLQEVPTKALLDYLGYLIEIGDLARIQSVCAVFAGRDDRQRYKVAFDSILSQFAFAECGALAGRLARIYRSAEKADAKVAALFCAYGDQRSLASTSQQPAQIAALSQNGSSPGSAGEAATV
jgi:CHAT domain-containing protein